ncbi:DUF732 domain-containing protein [Streptomyces sp. NPDC001381]|uniref:DUF732 domain-containing protein n=1 Tax=Streptomyces sp. NPDC001381 TaxID=3364567 RepID=UPI003679C309
MRKVVVGILSSILVGVASLATSCGSDNNSLPANTITATATETVAATPSPTSEFLSAIERDLPTYYGDTSNDYMVGLAYSVCEQFRNETPQYDISSWIVENEELTSTEADTFVSDALAYCG